MLEIQLDNVSPDGDKYVAYVKVIDTVTGKEVGMKCIPYTTEAKFDTATKKFLTEQKTKHEAKESVKTKVLSKLSAINKGEVL